MLCATWGATLNTAGTEWRLLFFGHFEKKSVCEMFHWSQFLNENNDRNVSAQKKQNDTLRILARPKIWVDVKRSLYCQE